MKSIKKSSSNVLDFSAGVERLNQKDEEAKLAREQAVKFTTWLSQQLPRARQRELDLLSELFHIQREILALEDGREFSDVDDLMNMLDDDQMGRDEYLAGIEKALKRRGI